VTGPTLRELLRTIGPTVLTPVCAPAGLDVEVSDVVVHDRRGVVPALTGGLLLAVGLSPDDDALLGVVESAGKQGYAAVVIQPLGVDPAVVAPRAQEAGVAVLATPDELDWRRLDGRISDALRSLAPSDPGDGPTLGDLFGLANAIALSVGAAIAIEDPQRRILAYSNLPDQPIDEVRREGILGRQVPDLPGNADDYRTVAQAGGVVRFGPVPPGLIGRMGIAVRAGNELLGSLWAVDDGGRLGPEAERVLADAARLAALHLLRARSWRGVERVERAETLRALLVEGDVSGQLGATRHGLTHDTTLAVAAFSVGTGRAMSEGQVARLADLVSLHLEAWHTDTLVTTSGGIVYAALPMREDATSTSLLRPATDVAKLAHRSLGVRVRVGIGDRVTGPAGVARSGAAALRVLRALGWSAGSMDVAVATVEQEEERILLQGLLDAGAVADEALIGPVRLMVDHDARAGTDFAKSVLCYLDEAGGVPAAAVRLNVHVNTLRHRLRRAEQKFSLDLDDPDARLVTWLQLRLLEHRGEL